ncbi:hypothetical protein BT96DRAFT_620430 [Gymnopus androsaceus JB14]|uniref:Uncharacterized protein n=1 Tax=Gymnopus androsaceus JB14 TaxID=1447944 RepID=A0A6A4HSN5_9AGAR|nr:hypothetical protein BT96DRAFT_620430 [Gymnopus androsaceus JB14]
MFSILKTTVFPFPVCREWSCTVELFTSFPTVFKERVPTLVWEREADGASWLIGCGGSLVPVEGELKVPAPPCSGLTSAAVMLLINEPGRGVDDFPWLIDCAGMVPSPCPSPTAIDMLLLLVGGVVVRGRLDGKFETSAPRPVCCSSRLIEVCACCPHEVFILVIVVWV